MRVVRLIAFYLVVGVLATSAVTWGLAAWLPHRGWVQRSGMFSPPAFQGWIGVDTYVIPGAQRVTWEVSVAGLTNRRSPFFKAINDAHRSGAEIDEIDARALRRMRWSRLRDVAEMSGDELQAVWVGCDHATGCPLLAAWYEIHKPANAAVSIVGGISISPKETQPVRRRNPALMRALPLHPIWTGIVINSLFYAIASFGVVSAFGRVRRWNRRRRNRCAGCAYDLAGLTAGQVCPECGRRAVS